MTADNGKLSEAEIAIDAAFEARIGEKDKPTPSILVRSQRLELASIAAKAADALSQRGVAGRPLNDEVLLKMINAVLRSESLRETLRPGSFDACRALVAIKSAYEQALSTPPSEPRQSERDAVIEECALICDEEAALRNNRALNPEPGDEHIGPFDQKMVQTTKAITAELLANKLRDRKSTPSQKEAL